MMSRYKVKYQVDGHKKSKFVYAENKKEAYLKVGIDDCKIKEVKSEQRKSISTFR